LQRQRANRQKIDPRSAEAKPGDRHPSSQELLTLPLTRLCLGSFFDPPGRQGAARLLKATPFVTTGQNSDSRKNASRRGHARPVFQALRSETPPKPAPAAHAGFGADSTTAPIGGQASSTPETRREAPPCAPTLPAYSLRSLVFAAAPPAHAPSGRRSLPCRHTVRNLRHS